MAKPPPGAGPQGIALVDKPAGWTSHDVVAKARGKLGTKKVGHSGTLDPSATGLLVLGVGRATKLLTYLTGVEKTYTGEAVLGTATSTLDAEGEITGTWDMAAVTTADVRAAAAELTGALLQVPPMVSAKKVGGRRLHELARAGVEVEREPVPVHVARFDVGDPVEPGVYPITVTCSSGTYVRSLVADLGTGLGGGAHLRNLRRHRVGPFAVDEAVTLEALGSEHVLPPLAAFRGTEPVVVTGAVEAAVRHGAVLPRDELGAGATEPGPWPVVDATGALLAVYVAHRPGTVKPGLVLVP
jgi:tRNA pseudouridine55 synthase